MSGAIDAASRGNILLMATGRAESAPLVSILAVALALGALAAWLISRRLADARAEADDLRGEVHRLSGLERTRAEFIAMVSHELRTPLTALRGSLGLVLHDTADSLSPRALELLRIAEQNTNRLIRLSNGLLDSERLDADDQPLRADSCNVTELLHTTATLLAPMADERGVMLAVDAAESFELSGDPDRLVQVFTNLLANAIRYSPRGECVRVSTRLRGDRLQVDVIDRGPGIAPEFRSRIFGRFQRAHDASNVANGAGLGLSISRAIVQRHGGAISFDCPPSGGTTFTVTLPAPVAGEASGGGGG
ncbi:MAG TPA: HAMP domain-containing sensor histidine kinase [Gemmatimonadaceae bacterium]|nr:HAMP domain-containing sensor histidine kinase [Gemmatimonadaceae bacterium]